MTRKIIYWGSENLPQTYEIDTNLNQHPKTVSKLYVKADTKAQMERFKEKQLHGYISTKLNRDVKLDKNQSLSWRRDRYIESKTEAYMSAIIEQEIPTKYMQRREVKMHWWVISVGFVNQMLKIFTT